MKRQKAQHEILLALDLKKLSLFFVFNVLSSGLKKIVLLSKCF